MTERAHPALSERRPRLIKLVRDYIGQFLDGDSTVTYEVIPNEHVLPALRAKLLEEVGEYLVDPCLGELADVYEVVCALADAEGFGLSGVQAEAGSKVQERGGFYRGVGMYITTTAPARHEGRHARP
jgi:predicted house-cleaning noncanonical NTP pyrophosphatase (MazG superfamily)